MSIVAKEHYNELDSLIHMFLYTIFQVRGNKWEAPKTDVTKLVEEENSFVDCLSDVLLFKKSGPIATCRYAFLLIHQIFVDRKCAGMIPVLTTSIGISQ